MFEELTERFEKFIRNVRGQGKLSEDNVRETVREVRRILLQADVSLQAAKSFVDSVQTKAMGQEVLTSVTPGQMMVKIIYDELTAFLGGNNAPLQYGRSPSPILMVGLNGAGKTTTAAKLAVQIKRKGRHPLLVAADTHRPAAADQLTVLGKQIDVPVFTGTDRRNPLTVVKAAREYARSNGLDCLIVDAAGRTTLNQELMDEIAGLYEELKPPETLLVVDSMTGQDAIRSAQGFLERIPLTGLILTKLDGDARGGSALSIRFATGCPIKYIGVGEKVSDLEPFHPDRMASRILGMGDIISLVEKAQNSMDIAQAAKLASKLQAQEFNLEDFRDQLRQIKKMGSLESLIKLIPGAGQLLKGASIDDGEIVVVESIIDSMTIEERRNPKVLNGSRRKRIANGCGRSVAEVNRLMNQFVELQKLMKRMGGKGGKGFRMPTGFGFRH